MFWVVYGVLFLAIIAVVRIIFLKRQRDWEYHWRKDRGHFYMEDGKLFVNVAYPQRVQAVRLEELDHIDFHYSEKERARGAGFMIFLYLVKKDGTAGKDVTYLHSLRHPYCPEEMMSELDELGVRYELSTGPISSRERLE